MLSLYRRHRATCRHRSRRAKGCTCPVWVQGVAHGESIRQSLDLTNWEAANKVVRDWEIHGRDVVVSVRDAVDRWTADCVARNLKRASMRKYGEVGKELKAQFDVRPVREISVDDLRKLREGWKLSARTMGKRLDFIRGFFNFCVDSGWLEKNPAKSVKSPIARVAPTLPFTEDQMEKLLWSVDTIREIHPQIYESTEKKLRALVLLIRYSGLRISDAVVTGPERNTKGKLFLYTQKTGTPVWCPLPKIVLDALKECDEGDRYYFWSGNGTVKSKITEWQERMKKACIIAGIPDGHFHRLRDTFAVGLLQKGTPIETVAVLLGITVQVCQKHYSPWVKSRQDALEESVKLAWG